MGGRSAAAAQSRGPSRRRTRLSGHRATQRTSRRRAHPARPLLRAHRAGWRGAARGPRPRDSRRAAGGPHRSRRVHRVADGQRGPAADRRVAAVARRLRRGRARRHGGDRGVAAAPAAPSAGCSCMACARRSTRSPAPRASTVSFVRTASPTARSSSRRERRPTIPTSARTDWSKRVSDDRDQRDTDDGAHHPTPVPRHAGTVVQTALRRLFGTRGTVR